MQFHTLVGVAPLRYLLQVVGVAVSALAHLSRAHATNRDKIATRHCCAQLLALAQSDVVRVQRHALRTMCADVSH